MFEQQAFQPPMFIFSTVPTKTKLKYCSIRNNKHVLEKHTCFEKWQGFYRNISPKMVS